MASSKQATGGGPTKIEATLRRRLDAGDIVAGERCFYLPDQLILSDLAARVLEPDLAELQAVRVRDEDGRHGFLDELGLQLWRLVVDASGPNLAERAAELKGRALARLSATRRDGLRLRGALEPGAATDDADEPVIVSLNHVLLGQPHPHGAAVEPPQRTGARRLLEPAPEGADADIAILDTGVPTPQQLAAWHPALEKSVRRDPANLRFPDDVDTLYEAGGAPELRALAGHGTFIAGLVHLVAPDLVISPYAVLDPDGIGNDIDVARAMLRVSSRPMSVPVVSLSLGGYTYDDAPPPALAHVVDRLPRTTVVVASAGNDGGDRPFFPAALGRVVAVAAFDDLGGVVRPVAWSNTGPWVDVCAPGVGLLSTYVAGTYEVEPGHVESFDEPDPSARWSGTSFASPLVAAEIARRVKEDADTGTWPSGPLTAEQAWRDLQAELEPLDADRRAGLVYWPPIDPRTPRLP
jgi:subtilisin family serine protease